MAFFLSVLSSFLVGLVLVVAPWTALWETNYLLHPAIRGVVLSAFIRGTVSGLGLVNILLAVHEARQHMAERGDRT